MAQIVSVDGHLASVLAQTKSFVDNLGERRVNDASSYNDVVERLDKLTSAYFKSVAGTSFLTGPAAGPRFDAAAGTALAGHVTCCVEYLRETALELIKDQSSLSRYERGRVDDALGFLKGLYTRLMSSIEDHIVNDVRELRELGPFALIAAGEIVRATGKRAAKMAEQPSEAAEVTSGPVVTNPSARLRESVENNPLRAFNVPRGPEMDH
jgi:hypothetical protein